MMLAFGLIAKPKASMNGVDRKDKKSSCKFFLFTGVMNNVSISWDPYVMVFFFQSNPQVLPGYGLQKTLNFDGKTHETIKKVFTVALLMNFYIDF